MIIVWLGVVCNYSADLLGRTFTPLVKILNLAIYYLPLPGIPALILSPFLGDSLRDRKDITAHIQTLMQALHCTRGGGMFHCMLQVQYPVWERKRTMAEQGSLPTAWLLLTDNCTLHTVSKFCAAQSPQPGCSWAIRKYSTQLPRWLERYLKG